MHLAFDGIAGMHDCSFEPQTVSACGPKAWRPTQRQPTAHAPIDHAPALRIHVLRKTRQPMMAMHGLTPQTGSRKERSVDACKELPPYQCRTRTLNPSLPQPTYPIQPTPYPAYDDGGILDFALTGDFMTDTNISVYISGALPHAVTRSCVRRMQRTSPAPLRP